MMVAVSSASAPQVSLGSVIPIRSVPLPAWTYLPQADRPSSIPARTEDAFVALAHACGSLAALFRHAPGAADMLPRVDGWAQVRAARAEGMMQIVDPERRLGDGAAAEDSAQGCWTLSLADWAALTGGNAAPRRAAAWIGPSAKLPGGASTVPPPPNMLKDALLSWQRSVDATGERGEAALIRASLDAAWSMWCIHFLHPVDQANGLLARIVAARTFAARARLAGMPVVPGDAAAPLRVEESTDLAVSYESWVRTTVQSLADDASRVIAGLERACRGRDALLDAASRMRAPRHPTMLAQGFVRQPRMTMHAAAHAMGVSFRAAQAVMDKFLESGLVHEETGRRRDRIYVCTGVMLDAPAQGERLPEPSVR
jgi:hypothetical protein